MTTREGDRPVDPVTPPEPRPLTADEERAIRDRDEMWRLQRDGSWTYLERGAFTQPMHEHTEQAISDRRQLLATLDEARALPSTPTEEPSVCARCDHRWHEPWKCRGKGRTAGICDCTCGVPSAPSTPTDREAALRAAVDVLRWVEDVVLVDTAPGHQPAAIHRLRAALAATPAEPAGLDVERLALAIEVAIEGTTMATGDDAERWAPTLAAEYARLGEPR